MGFGFLVMLLLWGALLAVVVGGAAVLFGKTTGTSPLAKHARQTPRQLLDERLARGEITPEEYEEILARIER